jgi:hypothetical protein
MTAHELSFSINDHFTELTTYDSEYPVKSNYRISTWNFVHMQTLGTVCEPESLSSNKGFFS